MRYWKTLHLARHNEVLNVTMPQWSAEGYHAAMRYWKLPCHNEVLKDPALSTPQWGTKRHYTPPMPQWCPKKKPKKKTTILSMPQWGTRKHHTYHAANEVQPDNTPTKQQWENKKTTENNNNTIHTRRYNYGIEHQKGIIIIAAMMYQKHK